MRQSADKQRIAPWIHQAQPVLQDVLNKTAEINSALGARASAVVQSSSDISHALLEQLKQLAEQGKDLPASLFEVSPWFEAYVSWANRAGCWQGYWRRQDHCLAEGCLVAGQIQQAWSIRLGE
jgi:hypothetical protein